MGGATGSVAGNIVDNSILAINGNDSPIVANTISGTGALQQNGADNVFLTGTNTFTGTTTIANGGTLTLSAPAAGTTSLALQNSTLNYNHRATLLFDTAVNVATLGGLTGTQNIALSNTNATLVAVTLNVGNNGSSTTYSGALTGSGSLVKVGLGTFTLAGANTYTGTTSRQPGQPDHHGLPRDAVGAFRWYVHELRHRHLQWRHIVRRLGSRGRRRHIQHDGWHAEPDRHSGSQQQQFPELA